MTHKERVIKALNHQETDRVPFMYRDVPEVRARLKKDLNLANDEALFKFLDIDFRWVQPEYVGKPLDLPNGHKRDIWGVEWKYTRSAMARVTGTKWPTRWQMSPAMIFLMPLDVRDELSWLLKDFVQSASKLKR